MRGLPAYSDRFWQLKTRRNELRAQAPSEWLQAMRYGTDCLPVFAHGIPEGWRERWRLIREFVERWHRRPLGDVGGRAKSARRRAGSAGRCRRRWASGSRSHTTSAPVTSSATVITR